MALLHQFLALCIRNLESKHDTNSLRKMFMAYGVSVALLGKEAEEYKKINNINKIFTLYSQYLLFNKYNPNHAYDTVPLTVFLNNEESDCFRLITKAMEMLEKDNDIGYEEPIDRKYIWGFVGVAKP